MTERFVMRDAINALRETSGESHDADTTRQRIVGTIVHKKRQRRHAIAMLLIVFVGLPLGTTAYAAFFGTPAFVQAWFDRMPERAAATPKTVTTKTVTTKTATAKAATPSMSTTTRELQAAPGIAPPAKSETVSPPIAAASTNASSTHSSTTRSVPDRAKPAATPTATSTTTRAEPVVVSDASDALYTRAHQLHFVTRDPAAALAAWDTYIAQARSATLLPEAQYNRALCLVRLRRTAEAITALSPFASGAHGNYRKREATALLNALQH